MVEARLARLRGICLIATLGGGFHATAFAAADTEHERELEIGGGVTWAPDYSGSNGSSSQPRLWVNGAWHTADFGTFAIDSGSLTIDPELRWDFVESPRGNLGVLLGYRPGRNDNRSSLWSLGSGNADLRGLAQVDSAIDIGVQGYIAPFGVPLFAQVRSALNGTQGTLVNLGVFAVLPLGLDGDLTILPTVTWANARQMRAFYGVSPVEANSSPFVAYAPGAGWENYALETVADWPLTSHWHLIASLAYQRLIAGAAASPLVQNKNLLSGLIGFAWHL